MSLTVLSNETSAESDSGSAPKDPAEEAIRAFYKVAKACADLLGGPDQAAIRMKVDRSDLTRALNRNGRYLTADHIIRLGTALRDEYSETAQRLAVALVAPMGFLVMTRSQMTAAEKKDRLLSYVRRCFPTCEEMISKALGPTDPCAPPTPAEVAHRLTEMLLALPFGKAMLREALDTPAPVEAP